MRWSLACGASVTLALLPVAAHAQFNDASLLPIPAVQTQYPATAYGAQIRATAAATHHDQPAQFRQTSPQPVATPVRAPGSPEHLSPWHYGNGLTRHSGIDPACDSCGYAPCDCPTCWYGSAGGLWMTRDDENPVWLSFDTADPSISLLSSRDADMGWGGGVDTRLGRYLGCGRYAIEAAYWGAYPSVQEANAFDPDGTPLTASDLSTTFSFNSLDYNGLGNPVVAFYDNAFRHRLRRSYQIHNIELNLIGSTTDQPLYARNCLRASWSAGIRYLRFSDGFDYAGDTVDTVFDGNVNEVAYTIDVVNDMVGGQVGGRLDYSVTQRLSVYGGAQVGIFGNRMSHRSFIGGAAGAAVVNDPTSPFDGAAFDISSNKYDVSLLGELDFGMNWQLTHHWGLGVGYRAVGIADIGLTTNQIPFNFGDIPGVADIDSNGSLILHGGYAFAEFSY